MSPFNDPFDGGSRPRRIVKNWPVRLGWDMHDIPYSFVFYQEWPIDNPNTIWARSPWLEYGWTLHIGPLKVHFGG